jgi:hypothetical protein
MSDWFERASAQLEQDLAEGFITYEDFKEQMKDLRRELRESERGCDDGGW